ncbi:hypothetical protein BGX28_008864 [Mortierella sp. GBA30]|nr:hypothetical protein BGX28_008864 [Mortierella sp. GBA30]
MDHDVINKRIAGLAEKFSMKGQDAKAEALQNYLTRLRRLARSLGGGDAARTIAASSEMDQEENAQNMVSSMLLMCLELSETPTILRNNDPVYSVPDSLKDIPRNSKTQAQVNKELWKAILKEDPLVGEHWREVGNEERESEGSDYEDMDVNPRIVPVTRRTSPIPTGDMESSKNRERGAGLNLWARSAHDVENSALFRMLERQQYWRDGCLVPCKTTDRAQDMDRIDIQCASALNSALRTCRNYSLAQETPVMDEADIINEAFLLLQGLPTLAFTVENGCAARRSKNIAVSHLSPYALHEILQPFLETAEAIIELQSVVDAIISGSLQVQGKVIQTFGAAIHSELIELRSYMALEQQKYQRYRKEPQNRMASLIELHRTLSDRLGTVQTLLNFLKDCQIYKHACSNSTDLLSRLYENLCHLELIGDWNNAALFQRLLQQSLRPFLINLECWMTGRSLDSEFEFMIQSNKAIDLFSNEFWTEGCSIQTDIVDIVDGDRAHTSTVQITPRFLNKETLTQILYTGKAIRIVQTSQSAEPLGLASRLYDGIFKRSTSSVTQSELPLSGSLGDAFPNYGPIITHQYPMSSMRSVTTSQRVEYTPNIDFMWKMEQELQTAIKEHYLASNSQLKSMLFAQSQLLWHLRGMSEFYFMMQGEVMHAFCTSLFRKFVKTRFNDQITERPSKSSFSGLEVQALDRIEFEYLLKIVKLSMEQMSFLKSRPKRHPELGHFWKLRLRFLSTMNDLWTYFMTTVLDAQVQKFHLEVENQTGDLDDMIQLSRRFINICYERCFLKERTQPLHRSLMTMLNLALKFSTIFSTFIQEQEESGEPYRSSVSLHPSTRDQMKGERRVSFNLAQARELRLSKQGLDEEDDASDSESVIESFDKGQDAGDDANRHGEIIGGVEDSDVDIALDGISPYKKLKTSSDLSGFPRGSFERDSSERRRWTKEANHSGRADAQSGYSRQLEGIELEFNRCKEFLAKSLRIVVSSNAARGYAARGQRRSMLEGQGDSNYLDGLILALSS